MPLMYDQKEVRVPGQANLYNPPHRPKTDLSPDKSGTISPESKFVSKKMSFNFGNNVAYNHSGSPSKKSYTSNQGNGLNKDIF